MLHCFAVQIRRSVSDHNNLVGLLFLGQFPDLIEHDLQSLVSQASLGLYVRQKLLKVSGVLGIERFLE